MNWAYSDLLLPFMSLRTTELTSNELVKFWKPHRMTQVPRPWKPWLTILFYSWVKWSSPTWRTQSRAIRSWTLTPSTVLSQLVYLSAPWYNILLGFIFSNGIFPGGSDGKASAYNAGRPGFNPWIGKIPWRRKWQPTPMLLPGKSHGWRSLENPMDGGAWRATVHGFAKSRTQLSDFTFFHFSSLCEFELHWK